MEICELCGESIANDNHVWEKDTPSWYSKGGDYPTVYFRCLNLREE